MSVGVCTHILLWQNAGANHMFDKFNGRIWKIPHPGAACKQKMPHPRNIVTRKCPTRARGEMGTHGFDPDIRVRTVKISFKTVNKSLE